jgi:hypothetical protein
LYDFFIGAASQEDMLFIVIGVEFNTIGDFAIRISSNTFSGFCIPHFHIFIIATAEKTSPIIRETNIANSLIVSQEGT